VKSHHYRRSPEPNVAEVAALIGDPGRAAMLLALLDGRELPASELALRGGLTPQAATAHLKKLVAAGLLAARSSGRHRFFRLASADVGHAIETLAAIARPATVVALDQSTTLARLRVARSCYDHLAGRLGVAVTDHFVSCGAIERADDAFALTGRGENVFRELGVDVAAARDQRRSFARACIDWTERRAHLAGSLGAGVLQAFLERKWVLRNASDRALKITPDGHRALKQTFKVDIA
jgi:DNA-binding transcriptional ArsR family regulator